MERMRVLDPKADRAAAQLTYDRAVQLLPAFGQAGIASAWAGFVDSTPDGVPGIGEVAEVPGFILATGFSGHGFGIGPWAGHLIADLVTGDKPIFDPAPYKPGRFSESAWGKVAELDVSCPPELMRNDIASQILGARFYVVPRASHMITLSSPVELAKVLVEQD